MTVTLMHGDCRAILPTLAAGSVQCCVTSPPYYSLRDYGVAGQIGLEPTPDAYVAEMVAVFRDVRRVLRDDGTLWLNVGDSYASNAATARGVTAPIGHRGSDAPTLNREHQGRIAFRNGDVKGKDLIGIPWLLAFALRADGWWLRSAITWCKPAPMPESVTDRPTSATEQVFLLTKRPTYFYDAAAIAEPAEASSTSRLAQNVTDQAGSMRANGGAKTNGPMRAVGGETRNARNWWVIPSSGFSGAHFATMPPDLAERCIKAGTRPGDMVLDPFGGAGTTGLVADRLNRNATLIELNPAYGALARDRIVDDAPLLAVVA